AHRRMAWQRAGRAALAKPSPRKRRASPAAALGRHHTALHSNSSREPDCEVHQSIRGVSRADWPHGGPNRVALPGGSDDGSTLSTTAHGDRAARLEPERLRASKTMMRRLQRIETAETRARERERGAALGLVLVLLVVVLLAGSLAVWGLRSETASAGTDR